MSVDVQFWLDPARMKHVELTYEHLLSSFAANCKDSIEL